jgi:hypothetical protein
MAHKLNSDWFSVALIPLPTSSMSGSFHAPGPAKEASPTLMWKLFSMLEKLGWMSVVVRHRFDTGAAQVHGWTLESQPLHMLNTIGRPVAESAFRIRAYKIWATCWCDWPEKLLNGTLHQSYLR